MKYQIGDIVLILHSNEEGRVLDFINDKMMLVEVGKTSFPVYMDQVDFPYFKNFTEKKNNFQPKERKYVDDLKKEKPVAANNLVDGVWLNIIPVSTTDEFGDEVLEKLKLHLVNKTATAYHFIYSVKFFGNADFELNNTVPPFNDFYLHDVPFENLNDSPGFSFDFSLINADKNKADHFETTVRLKAKQLFARIEEMRQQNKATFGYKLFDVYPDKTIDDKVELGRLAAKGYKIYEASKARQHLEAARSVVDLHIEKIVADWKPLSNFEILSLQLKTFEKFYDLALAHHQPSLIIIHGVGEGVLRDEVHAILRSKKEVKSFVNQYDPRFGYGATEIFFQY